MKARKITEGQFREYSWRVSFNTPIEGSWPGREANRFSAWLRDNMTGRFNEERLIRYTVVFFMDETDAMLAYMAHR